MNSIIYWQRNRRRFLQLAGITITALLLAGLPHFAEASDEAKPKIGIVGSGKVGGGIGQVWVKAGYEVMFSSRRLEYNQELAARLGANAYAGTPREAAAFGDVIMISVPYHALPGVGEQLAELIKGKIVIDTNNPFPSRDGEIALWAKKTGVGPASRELLPGARIVRAFNAIGAARMATAYQVPGKIGMPIASDDAEAAEIVSRLIRDMGYEPVMIGDLERGNYLVPFTSPLAGEHTADEIRKIAATLD